MSAAKNQATLGPQTGAYNLRTKKDLFEWGGMIPDGNPASLPDNRPRRLYNARFRNGGIVPRGGQAAFNASALHSNSACIRSLADFQIGTKKSLYMSGAGCPGLSSTFGFFIGSQDFDQSPFFQPAVYYDGSTVGVVFGVYGGDLYFGVDAELKKYQPIAAPYGVSQLALSGSSQDIPIVTPSGTVQITCLKEFDGKLFLGCDSGTPGTCRVVAWNGLTEMEDVTGLNAPTGFGIYREVLIMGYGGAPNRIDIRAVGAPAGTWTNVAPGAGTAAFKRGVSYKDKFYFTTGADDIFVYDGTAGTLTRITTATTGIAASSITWGIAVFNNLLYIAYKTALSKGRLAKYDGTTWTPIEKDFTTQFTGVSSVRPLATYRGNLVVGATDSTGGVTLTSPGTSTSGTWVREVLNGSSSGALTDFLVY